MMDIKTMFLLEKGKIMTTKPPKTLSNDECHQLLEQLQKHEQTDSSRCRAMRDFTMALLMLDAGLRVGEVVQLKVSDLIYDQVPIVQIRVRPEISKRHYERWVPVADRLKAAIGQMNGSIWEPQNRDPSSIAFYSSKRTERISYQHVEQIIKQAAHSFTSRNITPHMLRHTFATNLMRKTDMPTLQQLLGHKRLSSTQIYTHPSSEDRRRAIDRMQESS